MKIDYVPLLQVQRDLYELPRGFLRFREYLTTMIDDKTGDLELPLVAMNPMGKDHLVPFLDQLLALDADGVAARVSTEIAATLPDIARNMRAAIVVSDDLMGGWTNRYVNEFNYRLRERALYKRGWITTILWTSEAYTLKTVYREAAQSVHRFAYIQVHGYAQTLRDALAQEGWVMAQAGCTHPVLDADDLDYSRTVLADYLDATVEPVLIPALFGDEAARELGYTPLGLSPRAGLAVALANAGEGVDE